MGRKPLFIWSGLCLASLSLTGCWNDWCCFGDGNRTIKKEMPPPVPPPRPSQPVDPPGGDLGKTSNLNSPQEQSMGPMNNSLGIPDVKSANAPSTDFGGKTSKSTSSLNTNAFGAREATASPGSALPNGSNKNQEGSRDLNDPSGPGNIPAMGSRPGDDLNLQPDTARPQMRFEDLPRASNRPPADKTPSTWNGSRDKVPATGNRPPDKAPATGNDPVSLDPQKIKPPPSEGSPPAPAAPAPDDVQAAPAVPAPPRGTSQSKYPANRPGPLVAGVPVMPSGPSPDQ
jgi:hypothetical protein